MHDPNPMTQPVREAKPRRAAALLLLVAVSALGLGACQGAASFAPSVNVPTLDPGATPVAGCVDAPTMAVIDQLTAAGADVPAILAANKDILIAGLNTLQPADEATTTWRDELVDALENGDMDAAALQVDALASGGVTLTAC
jgi:hypothetical protein